tara:strand:- start:77 stop:424 length:348 start_codon:yes stop_codon:yes gene_type:complete
MMSAGFLLSASITACPSRSFLISTIALLNTWKPDFRTGSKMEQRSAYLRFRKSWKTGIALHRKALPSHLTIFGSVFRISGEAVSELLLGDGAWGVSTATCVVVPVETGQLPADNF